MPERRLDFLVIGAQKAGTTSLFEYLRRHPELELPPHKEAPFFSHDPTWTLGWEAYIERTFGRRDAGKKRGTVTPQYMAGGVFNPAPGTLDGHYDESTVPLRIQKYAPDVRLIVLLREPISRAISHHTMCVMSRDEDRSFDQAIEELLARPQLAHARTHPVETTGYIVWGEYGRILRAYVDVFGRDRMLVLFTDDLERSPDSIVQRVERFLDVRTDFVPDNLGMRYREASAGRRLSWLQPYRVQDRLARTAAGESIARKLPPALRFRAYQAFARTAYRLTLWNRRPVHSSTVPLQETRKRLQDHYAADLRDLIGLIGETPPWVASEESV
jgi:hypothetical protein